MMELPLSNRVVEAICKVKEDNVDKRCIALYFGIDFYCKLKKELEFNRESVGVTMAEAQFKQNKFFGCHFYIINDPSHPSLVVTKV